MGQRDQGGLRRGSTAVLVASKIAFGFRQQQTQATSSFRAHQTTQNPHVIPRSDPRSKVISGHKAISHATNIYGDR